MNHIKFILLFVIFIFACKEYEVIYPNVTLKIHIKDEKTGEPYSNYFGVLRTSNFNLSSTSPCYFEDPSTIQWDSSFSNRNGDFIFEIPFFEGVPQVYFELAMSKDNLEPLRVNGFLKNFVQCDTFTVGDLTQLNLEVRNDSTNLLTFSALGYEDRNSYKRDSSDTFRNPDHVTRIGSTELENTIFINLPYPNLNSSSFKRLNNPIPRSYNCETELARNRWFSLYKIK